MKIKEYKKDIIIKKLYEIKKSRLKKMWQSVRYIGNVFLANN